MSSLTKFLLATLAAVVLLFVTIALAVAFVFEPNDYRPLLVESVRDATGRDFALDGDLELKLFPCCGVRVGSAMLGNPPGFPDESFASIQSASVSVKLWPLLTQRQVQIGTVTLNGVDVRLTELADGRANWSFETDETAARTEEEDDAPSIASLTIEGLEIENGNVAYSGADGARFTVRNILVDAGAIGGSEPVPVAVKLTARDERAATEADIELVADLGLDGELLSVDQPRLTVRATGDVLPTGQASADVTAATLRYDIAAGTGGVEGIDSVVSLAGTRLEVRGDVTLSEGGATGSGDFRLPEGDLRQLLEALPEVDYTPTDSDALKDLTGSGRWALTETGAAMSELDLNLDRTRITGSVGIASFESGALTANLDIDRLNLDAYLPRAAPAAAGGATTEPTEVPFESLAELRLDANLKIAELTANGIAVQDLDASLENDGRDLSVTVDAGLLGGRAKLTGRGSPAGASPALAGQLELTGISPRAALTALGETLQTASPEALSQLSGSSRWRLGRRSLALEQMSWQLDATRLTGTLEVDDFDAPATRFDLALDRMDLDAYLAPDEDEATADDAADVEIPTELVRGLDLKGRLKAAALRIMDLELTELDASISADNGVLRLEPLLARLYGGTYRGAVTLDATGAKSRLSLDQEVSAVQIGQLLDALVGSDRMAGALTFNLTGSGEGNTQTELLRGLTGNVAFSLSDGVYHGMDIAYEIENAQSLLQRTAAPERPNRKETPIQALSFSGRMADGVLGSDDLTAEIPFLKLGGKGGVNLVERTLDYQLNARVLRSADGNADSGLKGLGGSTIPLMISGSMADPKVGVNLQGLVVETVKERARDELFKRLGINQSETTPEGAGSGSSAAASRTDSGEAVFQAAPTEVSGPAMASPTATTEGAITETAPHAEGAREEPAAEPPSPRDLIEHGLRGLLRKREAEQSENNG